MHMLDYCFSFIFLSLSIHVAAKMCRDHNCRSKSQISVPGLSYCTSTTPQVGVLYIVVVVVAVVVVVRS